MRTKHFGALDGLRACAIIFVVWFHTGIQTDGIYSRGLGVTLFFANSGFLITTILLREQAKTGTISVRNFYIRRILRIFPLYYSVLALYVVVVQGLERDANRSAQFFENLPYYFTFTSNWFVTRDVGSRVVFYFAWSLATLEQFYVVWPLVLRFARSWHFPVGVLTLQFFVGEATRWAVHSDHLLQDRLDVRILSGIASPICLGSLAAYLLHRRGGFPLGYRVAGQTWSAPLALGLVLLPLVFERAPMLLTTFAMVYLVMACAVRPGPLRPVLENRLVRHIGTVSYGIYLLHMLAVNLVRRLAPGQGRFVTFGLALTLTILAASMSYRYFEQPFLNLKKRFRFLAARTAS
jgi:peptidoglycan/LPS O-acetylase OafA/YrhL